MFKKLTLVFGLALQAALPAAAQNSIVLYGGVRGGGSLEQSVGAGSYATTDLASGGAGALSIDWALDTARNGQVFLATQRTALRLAPGQPGTLAELPMTITYGHLGGSNFIDGAAGRGAYVAGGIGATFLSPKPGGLKAELRPSLSAAFGYEQPVGSSLALRMELRGYATLIRSSGGFFCSGGCVVVIRGDALYQTEALLGLSARF